MPLLTVIMPAYRAADTVGHAVRSTLRAMPRDAELVVAVDGPDPATEEAARRIEDARLRVRPHPVNRGTVACMREALMTTDSEFVARTDADDVSMPWRFRTGRAALREADIVCGTGIRFGRGALPKPSYPGTLTSREIGLLLPFVNPLFHSSMLARRDALLAANAYAVPCTAEDYVLWFDALLSGARLVKTATPLVAYRLSRGQLSNAADYIQRVHTDPQVRRAYTAWAEASGMSWLLEHGGSPGAPVGTREQLDRVVAGVRPRTRRYARRHVEATATVLATPRC